MNKQTVPFTKEAVKKYLDDCILFSRKIYDSGGKEAAMCEYYIDAYQSIRTSLFGETLPLNDMIPEDFHMPSILHHDGDTHNLDFCEDEERTQSVNMMRIGEKIIDKNQIAHMWLGKGEFEDPDSVGIVLKQGGRMFEWHGAEAIAVRKFLIKQFPCEGQTLWLEDST